MIRYTKRIGAYVLIAGSVAACGGDPVEIETAVVSPSSGTANFSKYVALGSSMTAGYADGGVYRAGQLVSYPNLLAQQFALARGGSFPQPTYSEAQKDGTGYLKMRSAPTALLKTEFFGTGSPGFAGGIVGSSGSLPLYAKHGGANNNLGVPNIKVSDVLTPNYGLSSQPAFNPHFERLLGTTNSSFTYKQYVASESTGATFFSIWLGNDDVLAYANAGGTGAAMTDVANFTTNLRSLLNDVTATATKGVLIGIPQFTTFAPQFRTFTLASLPNFGSPPAQIFVTSPGGPVLATSGDLFLLSSQARYLSSAFGVGQPFPYGYHPNNPLVDADFLDATEVSEVVSRINELNAVIAAEAAARGLIFIDLNAADGFLEKANTTGFSGAPFNASIYTTAFESGGLFSLDGFTLTPVGNAILANEVIRKINATYGATLPLLNLSNYAAP